MKKAIMIDPQNKACACDDLKDERELETTPAPNEPTARSEAEEKDHPPITYLHIEIF
jgi:hypothetical protein